MESDNLNDLTATEIEDLYSDIVESPELLAAAKYCYYSSLLGYCCVIDSLTYCTY